MNSEQVSFLPAVETAKLVTKHGHLPPDEYDALIGAVIDELGI